MVKQNERRVKLGISLEQLIGARDEWSREGVPHQSVLSNPITGCCSLEMHRLTHYWEASRILPGNSHLHQPGFFRQSAANLYQSPKLIVLPVYWSSVPWWPLWADQTYQWEGIPAGTTPGAGIPHMLPWSITRHNQSHCLSLQIHKLKVNVLMAKNKGTMSAQRTKELGKIYH